ncbi:hypothetical protein GCM10007108_05450 [Thermogymnomonas acidicola]|uniref:Uncharacterized protein n=1 Tax=Thermogymnomonas acidicola TaxID=399579 RepID=A0AA37BQI9_9ARCH|nr:hypothetical protein [Thermogymnomonas acidicola]GGM70260.1 hypothetical protein GCM10007108_05450 [Thermogymnomonas acidicola]
MNRKGTVRLASLAVVVLLALMPFISSASAPPIPAPPSTLPTITYHVVGTNESYNITDTDWTTFFTDIIDNSTYVKYNWSANASQDLIIFDLSYTGLNPYGAEFVEALSQIGSPTIKNMTLAFERIENDPSQVKGYTNIQALNAGAYPGFSWSKPKVAGPVATYRDVAIIVAIIAVVFVLYFVFNRKK